MSYRLSLRFTTGEGLLLLLEDLSLLQEASLSFEIHQLPDLHLVLKELFHVILLILLHVYLEKNFLIDTYIARYVERFDVSIPIPVHNG